MSNLKIAIVCVYYVPETAAWILEQQLKHIEENCDLSRTKIYGADIRLGDSQRQLLTEKPYVQLFTFQQDYVSPNHEHGDSLTRLIQQAAADGADLILTLDVDSWPITKDWDKKAEAMLDDTDGVCAILRAENDDTHLPHPCGTVLSGDFARRYDFAMYPDTQTLNTPTFQHFLKKTHQRVDTGIGLAAVLYREKLTWAPLLRSNQRNLHYLMGGIYGDMFFHLGASSRDPIFRKDIPSLPFGAVIEAMREAPILWRLYAFFLRRTIAANTACFVQMQQMLVSSDADLIGYLNGSNTIEGK